MTFKGMLKILMNDFRKQYDEKMVSISDELQRTRLELHNVKQQLHTLQIASPHSSIDALSVPAPVISLFVQYNGFVDELCAISPSITIKDLLIKIHQITGISPHRAIEVRALSEDGLTSLFCLDDDNDQTLESYKHELKTGMTFSVEHKEEINQAIRSRSSITSERAYSHESDV